jgi:hypothetical protein
VTCGKPGFPPAVVSLTAKKAAPPAAGAVSVNRKSSGSRKRSLSSRPRTVVGAPPVGQPVTLVTSVAVLLPVFGSVTSGGEVTVAVFVMTPGAAEATRASTVNVALPPTGSVTVALMLPTPFDEPHVPPLIPTQVQLTPVKLAGNVSATVAFVTGISPTFETTIVY